MADQTEPAVKKLDLTIARLRLLLADVSAREGALKNQRRMFEDQRSKVITFALYGDTSLDSVLSMLADTEERLGSVEAALRSLGAVRARAESELESLQLTKGIEEAKVLLSELQAKQTATPAGAEPLTPGAIAAEIDRLQALIAEASERAAKHAGQSTRRIS
jgi:hypothetical protein